MHVSDVLCKLSLYIFNGIDLGSTYSDLNNATI